MDIVEEVAKVFLQEWGWHYQEWDVLTHADMVYDLIMNYSEPAGEPDCTYVALDSAGSLVGTIALLREDLLTHRHLTPWLTCLWVAPACRRRGLATRMVNHVITMHPTIYLWCYTEQEKHIYLRGGCQIVDEVEGACVMVMRHKDI